MNAEKDLFIELQAVGLPLVVQYIMTFLHLDNMK